MSRHYIFRTSFHSSVALIIALTLTASARAQQANTAIVLGTVQDATRAPLPGATITLTHRATNAPTVVTTDARGQYRTPPLRTGDYDLDIALEGFKRFTQRGVVLNI